MNPSMPISKSELMIHVDELTMEAEAWKDAALESIAKETLLSAAIEKHRNAKKHDAWGYLTLDANEELYATLDKVEAGVFDNGVAFEAGEPTLDANSASNGAADVSTFNIFGISVPYCFGGSD